MFKDPEASRIFEDPEYESRILPLTLGVQGVHQVY